jgi:hypothetical protein
MHGVKKKKTKPSRKKGESARVGRSGKIRKKVGRPAPAEVVWTLVLAAQA